MDKETAARRVLRSLCANLPDEEDLANENFQNTQFDVLVLTGIEKTFLDKLKYYYSTHGGAPSVDTIVDHAHDQGNSELEMFAQSVKGESLLWGANYSEMLQKYVDLRAEEFVKASLAEVGQILTDGKQVKEGTDNRILRGSKDAIEFGISRLTDIQRNIDPHRKPLSKNEAIDLLRDQYLERMASPTMSYGLGTGLSPIDDATKGAQPKEMWLFAGYTSHGKSTWMMNWARYLAVEGSFNILIYSLEMHRDQVWRLLACSHSAHPKFGRAPLEYEKIKSGTLADEDGKFYLDVVLPDLKACGGNIEVLNPRGRTTMSDIRAQAEVSNRVNTLDLIVVDYLALVAPERGARFNSRGDLINANIIESKRMALEFDHGQGIVVASAHQINRNGVKEAQKNGGIYEMSGLADANEAERTPDVVLTIYQDDPLRQKQEAVVTNLKNRDGRRVEPFNVYAPSQYRLIGELEQAEESQLDALLEA